MFDPKRHGCGGLHHVDRTHRSLWRYFLASGVLAFSLGMPGVDIPSLYRRPMLTTVGVLGVALGVAAKATAPSRRNRRARLDPHRATAMQKAGAVTRD
ncbi:MAG: hypothetical protein U1F59_05150 [Candidatus Competibacteraceae bacterium]